MVKVKICGITNKPDAEMAVSHGANALGFIFAPSPRRVLPEKVREIVNATPPFVQTVGVFVDEDMKIIRELVEFCGLDMVQLHGNETPEFCDELMPLSIKSFRLKDESSLLPLSLYNGKVRAFLLDTYQKGIKGGTGKVFDWALATKAGEMGMPLILSGGLNPFNIQNAIETTKPYAVDVNSGIEKRPGQKSLTLTKKLMDIVKGTVDGGL